MISKPTSGFSPIEKLSQAHDLSRFLCGHESLDDWLKKYAMTSQSSDTAKIYVVANDNRVVGYYALMAGSISVEQATARAKKGQPRAGMVPVALLARLAVDSNFQGRGLGKALLKDALIRCADAADVIGVRAVLVHALDAEAKTFYHNFDFEDSPVDDMTLMLMMKDIRAGIGHKK